MAKLKKIRFEFETTQKHYAIKVKRLMKRIDKEGFENIDMFCELKY